MTAKLQVSAVSAEESRAKLGCVAGWWEGESLYGWSSRMHALRGGNARTTGRLLFGREHACKIVDIPSGVGRLVEATRGQLGSTEEILRHRTVLASYWPFATDTAKQMVLDAAADVSGIPIPLALGLPASKLGADHPLRYCDACHRESLARDGYSTWLLRHQLPGVWWCSRHEMTLCQVPTRRAIWRKPGLNGEALGAPADADEQKALQTMECLAVAIAALERVNEGSLAASAVHRLRQIGIATSAVRLNTLKMSQWLEASPLIRWMRRQGDCVHLLSGKWANDLLRGRRRGHPLKWQMLWTCAWQGVTVDAAVCAFKGAAQSTRLLSGADQGALWPDLRSEVGTMPLPDNVATAFGKHSTLRDVAVELGITAGAVRQWLVDHPALAAQWLAQVRERRLQEAVVRIEERMRQDPSISRTRLLKACNTDFNWLGRNAPTTARALLDRVPTDRGPQRDLF